MYKKIKGKHTIMMKRLASLISTFFSSVVTTTKPEQKFCGTIIEEPKKKRRITTRMRTVKPKEQPSNSSQLRSLENAL